MSDVFRDGRFYADDWVVLDDDMDVPADGAAFVSLSRWMAERGVLAGRNAPLGVLIRAGDRVEDIEADVNRFSAIAVEFPKFTDGRGFSSARLLREDFGYTGEIRAIGDVLLDQIPLMRRCGVDTFDVVNEPTRTALEDGRMPGVSLYYQPVRAVPEVPAGTRPWARKPA